MTSPTFPERSSSSLEVRYLSEIPASWACRSRVIGNIGLGRETVYQLSKHNPSHIYLAARSKAKAEATISELKKLVPNAPISFLELDLASFDSIKKAVATFNESSDRLDLLFNNAGIMACPPGLTKEGYEIQFGTNHVGHALFTKLLLPQLKKTAAEPGSDVRIINLSSSAHAHAPKQGYLLDQVKTDMRQTSTWTRYGQSKLANIHFNRELARRNPDIKCIAVHPGFVRTNLIAGPEASHPLFAWLLRLVNNTVAISVQQGALNQLWAATSKDAKTGTFYFPVAVEGRDSAQAKDDKLSKQLWDWTEQELEGQA